MSLRRASPSEKSNVSNAKTSSVSQLESMFQEKLAFAGAVGSKFDVDVVRNRAEDIDARIPPQQDYKNRQRLKMLLMKRYEDSLGSLNTSGMSTLDRLEAEEDRAEKLNDYKKRLRMMVARMGQERVVAYIKKLEEKANAEAIAKELEMLMLEEEGESSNKAGPSSYNK